MNMTLNLVGAALSVALVAFPSATFAAENAADLSAVGSDSGVASRGPLNDNYSYTFDDDPLDADPFESRGERLRVRRGAERTLLIRPRTHFISELFKSAEDL